MTILVTGGAGFIGSHYVDYLLQQYPHYTILTLDKLTYAGSLSNLVEAQKNPNHRFIQGDILDKSLLLEIFNHYEIKTVVHFAAESHVDNSIAAPDDFIQTNIIGTFQLLEAARAVWQDKKYSNVCDYRFHHISTDEVYGSLGQTGYFSECSQYAPNSPYSASKASSDMLVRSYGKTYGLNVITSHCSNNFGPRQHDEKLIPTVIRHALQQKPIPIYGAGTNVRDWLYVVDHCRALDVILHQGKPGEVYDIGADCEQNNLALAKMLCQILDEIVPSKKPYASLIQSVTDRLGHDFRYAIDCSKLKALGWQPKSHLKQNLTSTIRWYLNKYQDSICT